MGTQAHTRTHSTTDRILACTYKTKTKQNKITLKRKWAKTIQKTCKLYKIKNGVGGSCSQWVTASLLQPLNTVGRWYAPKPLVGLFTLGIGKSSQPSNKIIII